MKPEELQLGDIVATTPSGMPIKVVAIHRKKVAYHACTDRFSWVRINLLQPVPLTDEILKKNGFDYENNVGDVLEYYNYELIYNTWEHELRILENREQILKIKTFDEMCVHELQHALRLCGINKEIKI